MTTKRKYTYQSYDYSFLNGHLTDKWSITFSRAVSAAARTIGFDLTEVHPMDEPVGQLYWTDATYGINDAESTATTYEPLHIGGLEVTFTATAPVPTEPAKITPSTAATYTQDEKKQTEPPYYRLPSLYPHYTDIERYRKAKSKAYFNNVKLRWKTHILKNHGKKI